MSELRLGDIFHANRGKKVVLVQPGGNWGDYLIYWGAEILAQRNGVVHRTIHVDHLRANQIGKDEIVYIHGSGGMNPWSSGRAALALKKALDSRSNLIIQGPTTYDNTDNYTAQLAQNLRKKLSRERVVLFARETESFELLETYAAGRSTIALDHDTALNVSREEFLHRANHPRRRYALCVNRRDPEADGNVPPSLSDLVIDPAIDCKSFEGWLRAHACAKRIKTNRLHSAIAGAILKIPTTLFPGSYHKNRSVWEYSLSRNGVTWSAPEGQRVSTPLWLKLAYSWKFNRLKRIVYGFPTV